MVRVPLRPTSTHRSLPALATAPGSVETAASARSSEARGLTVAPAPDAAWTVDAPTR